MKLSEDLEELLNDLRPMLRFLLPVALVAALLVLNLTMHAGAYLRPDRTIYIAPAITAPTPSSMIAAPVTTTTTTAVPVTRAWDPLADCESGEWDASGHPIVGSARWDDQRGDYEGGPHFAPATWTAYRPANYPAHAYQATRVQQITVAELVLQHQGERAWPVCAAKVGLR